MKRRRRTRETLGVSLFPFLAVLICTLGVLIVLLVLAVKSADVDATQAKADLQEQHQRELDELNFQIEARLLQIEGLSQVRPDAVKRLADVRSHRGHLEAEIRNLKRKSVELADKLAALDAPIQSEDTSSSEQIENLKQQLAAAQQELAKKRTESDKSVGNTYTIVPHAGNSGTFRRPIFVECVADALIIQPLGIRLEKKEFVPPLETGNMLDAALLAIREYLQRYDINNDEGTPYPLLVVRPSGSETYVLARRAMKSWDDEFGYELVEADKKLDFGDRDEQLAATVREAVEDARRRQRFFTAQRQAGQRAFGGRHEAGSDRYGPGLSASAGVGGFVAESDGKTESYRLAQDVAKANRGSYDSESGSKEFAEQAERDRNTGSANVTGSSAGESNGQMASMQNASNPESLANERGSNWGLPTQTPGATGYVRPIRVVCGAEDLEVRSSLGTEKVIAINGDMKGAIDPLVNEIWRQIESWGISGSRSYWKPELRISVLRGGEFNFEKLKGLLHDSGIVVKESSR